MTSSQSSPGSEDQWQHPPYGGEIVDGTIWGRGALDDKSAVIAQLEAATHLLRSGFTPQRTVYFSFGHDEEVGEPMTSSLMDCGEFVFNARGSMSGRLGSSSGYAAIIRLMKSFVA